MFGIGISLKDDTLLESALELGKPSLFANVLYLSKKDGTFNLCKRKS